MDACLSWQDAKNLFIKHYGGAFREHVWHDQLLAVKIRKGESIRAYADRFQELASRGLNETNENLVVSRFLQGLPRQLSESI